MEGGKESKTKWEKKEGRKQEENSWRGKQRGGEEVFLVCGSNMGYGMGPSPSS